MRLHWTNLYYCPSCTLKSTVTKQGYKYEKENATDMTKTNKYYISTPLLDNR